MPSKGGIKISQCRNGTPTKWKVSGIGMGIRAGPRPKVESCTCKYTVAKVSFKAGVCNVQWAEMVDIVCVKVGCPGSKTGWIEPVSRGIGGKIHTLLTGAKTSNANDINIA
jgi:hypothetical protein